MDCIDLFKRAAMALQTDPRYLVLDQARKANDKDEELQNMIGEFNLARMDLNDEIGKSERNDAIINTAMNGGDPMTVQEPSTSCTGSCSTCGGCH